MSRFPFRRLCLVPAGLLAAAVPLVAGAQATAAQPAPATPVPPAVSGIIVGNYQYLLGGPRKDFNQFALDRAYLTVRGTPFARTSFRLTSDVFQTQENGWTVRMKYAYLDYALRRERPWATSIRAGMLQTVTIEQHETFWPRWLGSVPIDRHGFFQSADVGVAAETRLPSQLGEVYAHVVNGPGYARRENDRFKDFGARLSLTPLAASQTGLLRSLTLSGWVYEGTTASALANDPVAPVNRGLARDRAGVHLGVRSPRLSAAVEHSRRTDATELVPGGATDPATVVTTHGSVNAAYAVVRPLAWIKGTESSRFGLVGRYDSVELSREADEAYHYLLGGAILDINTRLSTSLNYQEQLGDGIGGGFRGLFANLALSF
jgi:hypothetical protein